MSYIKILNFFLLPVVFFIWTQTAKANLLITEVQIAGETSSNDFIEIYNNSASQQDISGFKLRKRASTGSESSIRVFPKNSLIGANGYFLWANSANDFSQKINANTSSTQTLAKNNSVALFDADGNTIDALVWGDELVNPFVKGEKFSQNPEDNQSLARKFFSDCACYQNLNDNSANFILDTAPTPGQQNSATNQSVSEEQSSKDQPQEDSSDTFPNQENFQESIGEPTPLTTPPPTNDVPVQEQIQPISSPSPSLPSFESPSLTAPLSSMINDLPGQKNSTPPNSKIIAQSTDKNLSGQKDSQKPSTSTTQSKVIKQKSIDWLASLRGRSGQTKKQEIFVLIGVILLAFLSALGLIYFRRK